MEKKRAVIVARKKEEFESIENYLDDTWYVVESLPPDFSLDKILRMISEFEKEDGEEITHIIFNSVRQLGTVTGTVTNAVLANLNKILKTKYECYFIKEDLNTKKSYEFAELLEKIVAGTMYPKMTLKFIKKENNVETFKENYNQFIQNRPQIIVAEEFHVRTRHIITSSEDGAEEALKVLEEYVEFI